MSRRFGWCLHGAHGACKTAVNGRLCSCRCHCTKCGGAGEFEVRASPAGASPEDRRVDCDCEG